MNETAIASVPIQSWEKPFDTEKAFREGTIFPSLYKPFFIEKEMPSPKAAPQSSTERLLLSIQQTTFALTDITLYLDTHPEDQEALSFREKLRQDRKELLGQFAADSHPLTMDCAGLWTDGPSPWEPPSM